MLSSTTNTWEELIVLINFAHTSPAVHSISGASIYFGIFFMSRFAMPLFYIKRMLQPTRLPGNSSLGIQAVKTTESARRKQLLLL